MLSYHWHSHATACLINLLHRKMSECFCRHGFHQPDNELLWGQVYSLCRSQFEVHFTAAKTKTSLLKLNEQIKNKMFFIAFRWDFLCFRLCPLPHLLSGHTKTLAASSPPPPHHSYLLLIPLSFPFSRLTSPTSLIPSSSSQWPITGPALGSLCLCSAGGRRTGHNTLDVSHQR